MTGGVGDYRHAAVALGWPRDTIVAIDAYVVDRAFGGVTKRLFVTVNSHAIVLCDAARHSVWYRAGKVPDEDLPAPATAVRIWCRVAPKRARADAATVSRAHAKPANVPKPPTATQRARARRAEARDEFASRQEPLTEWTHELHDDE